jgi:uncharacterized Zn-finger protein
MFVIRSSRLNSPLRFLTNDSCTDKGCICDICGKSFSARQALDQHKRIHSGDKPFTCTHPGCDKRFAQGSALTMHLRTHTGEKPLKCDFPGCTRAFSESSNLSKHKKSESAFADVMDMPTDEYAVHEEEAKHECSICGKLFRRLDQVKRHQRSQHEGRAARAPRRKASRTPGHGQSTDDTQTEEGEDDESGDGLDVEVPKGIVDMS